MKCFQLQLKSKNRLTDPLFMAQVPLMPNLYLVELKGHKLALLKADNNPTLLLITDSNAFLERYLDYYNERFTVEEMPEDFVVPGSFEVVYGAMKFDNESEEVKDLEPASGQVIEE
jgi:hypothetical protein